MKKLLSLSICIVLFQTTSYLQPVITAQKTVGGSNLDQLTSMCLTKDNGLIVGGISSSGISGDKTQAAIGPYDYWIVKMNASGIIQWDKTFGGTANELFSCIRQTADGGYIIGGTSASDISGNKTQNSKGKYDYWIIKVNNKGIIQWDKTIGGSDNDWLANIEITNDGGYILGGMSASNISGDKTENCKGGIDYWIVKLDKYGNKKWDKTIGGSGADEFGEVKQTNDGGFIIGGFSVSGISGDKSEQGGNGYNYWVVKLDKNRIKQWDKTLTVEDRNYTLEDIMQTSDKGYLLTGYFDDYYGEQHYGNVVKMDSAGNFKWNKPFINIKNIGYDYLYSADETADKGYIVAGSTNKNYWVIKLNRSGVQQWQKIIKGNKDDYATQVKEIKKDNYVVGGYSPSDKEFDKTDSCRGSYDYWILSLNYKSAGNAATDENALSTTIKQNDINVYPNPARDILQINCAGKNMFAIFNYEGKILLTEEINNSGTINISAFSAGIYFLLNKNTQQVKKIIVVK